MPRTILTEPNPILRERSQEVDESVIGSTEIQAIIMDLKNALRDSTDGIGIAAPQVGIALRIFIISEESKYLDLPAPTRPQKEKKDWLHLVYINPSLESHSRKKVDGVEGCLSVPGKFGIVSRYEKVSVRALDERGKKIMHGASKFFARVLQHELDHLDGILFVDRAKRFVDITSSNERL